MRARQPVIPSGAELSFPTRGISPSRTVIPSFKPNCHSERSRTVIPSGPELSFRAKPNCHSEPELSFRAKPNCHSEQAEPNCHSERTRTVIPSPELSFRAAPNCHSERSRTVIPSGAELSFRAKPRNLPERCFDCASGCAFSSAQHDRHPFTALQAAPSAPLSMTDIHSPIIQNHAHPSPTASPHQSRRCR